MKFALNRGPRAEAVVTRLITLVLGTYALALIAQSSGIIQIA